MHGFITLSDTMSYDRVLYSDLALYKIRLDNICFTDSYEHLPAPINSGRNINTEVKMRVVYLH